MSVSSLLKGINGFLGSTLGSAATSALGSLSSMGFGLYQMSQQKAENEKNRQFNAQQALLSRQYNTAMVNEQNQYNTPSATMARLQEAGVNPALAYSNGTLGSVGVGNTGQSASGSGSVNGSFDPSGIMDMALKAAQLENVKANTNLQNSQADLTDAEKQLTICNIDIAIAEADIRRLGPEKVRQEIANLKATEQNIKTNTDNALKQGKLLDLEAFGKELDNLFQEKTFADRVEAFSLANNYTKEQTKAIIRTSLADAYASYAAAHLSEEQKQLVHRQVVEWDKTSPTRIGAQIQRNCADYWAARKDRATNKYNALTRESNTSDGGETTLTMQCVDTFSFLIEKGVGPLLQCFK